ncbi:pilus assembly protein PilM, partial [Pseudoalteromonas ruthenica]|uniref:pilus assembly protein PilM n=1 Tax=Pseudoalteromonas ruthenica TaxID=151081 RepID=UPI0012730534
DQVDYIVLSGGTPMIDRLLTLVIAEIGIHTVVVDPFASMQIGSKVDQELMQNHKAQFAVSAGLA